MQAIEQEKQATIYDFLLDLLLSLSVLSCRCFIEVLSQHSSGKTEESHENLWRRFKLDPLRNKSQKDYRLS
jgi:hypothetical protein